MLVLSRREGQGIVFPELGITIVVHRIRGKSLSIGIDAPPDVRILRNELADELAEPSTPPAPAARPRARRRPALAAAE